MAPQPVYNELGATAKGLFNMENTSISITKRFLTMKDELASFTFSEFTLMAPCDVKELRNIIHLSSRFFSKKTGVNEAFDICCSSKYYLWFFGENSP